MAEVMAKVSFKKEKKCLTAVELYDAYDGFIILSLTCGLCLKILIIKNEELRNYNTALSFYLVLLIVRR